MSAGIDTTATTGALPLAGVGVLITRPARQSGSFAQKVAALGGSPVIVPAIVILPPADPAPLARVHAMLSTYDAAVFVSANAVEYGAPAHWPARLPVFAPGPGTADALAAAGADDVRIPAERYDSEGLLALPELQEVAGKRFVLFRGDGGRELLAETLVARGATLEAVACYARAKPTTAAPGLAEAFAQGRIDAVTVTSSEGLANLWELADAPTRSRWRARPTFAPHSRIAEAARALGLEAVTTAGGDAGLLAGLLEWRAAFPPS